jgi:hypothetical protein
VGLANSRSNNLEATGIGACACSRHGCFVPHCVVDFQKGERYVGCYYTVSPSFPSLPRHINIDYAICEALKYQTEGMPEVLIIYDICCQWVRNFGRRVDGSPYLSLPHSMKIIPAVGKFHLGAHIRSCFPLHSLNFVHGAGQQDGEILETLWSSLNKVSSSVRAMSKAHRHEVLDDYMRDSNWKKIVGIGERSSSLNMLHLSIFLSYE